MAPRASPRSCCAVSPTWPAPRRIPLSAPAPRIDASLPPGLGTASMLDGMLDRFAKEMEGLETVVATGGGSATAGSDYTGVNQTLTFAAGETQKTVSIALTDDSAPEPNESFNVSISTASAGTLGSQTSVAVELTDNEQALWSVSADQASVSEAAGSAAFTVTRSGKTDVAATIVVSSVRIT